MVDGKQLMTENSPGYCNSCSGKGVEGCLTVTSLGMASSGTTFSLPVEDFIGELGAASVAMGTGVRTSMPMEPRGRDSALNCPSTEFAAMKIKVNETNHRK